MRRERRGQPDLAAAALRANEQKTGNVDAGNEEQQAGAGKRGEQDRTDVADDDIGERKQKA